MTEDTPDVPRNPPPVGPGYGPQQPASGGSIGAGVLLGAFALYALYVSATIPTGGPTMWPASYLGGAVAFVPVAAYLAIAIVLAVMKKTSRFGAGMLIGLGIFLLLGGGLCIGSLAQLGI
ncbi:hypothetical protein FJ661_08315 [Pseudarthrobacter phenanthrenivorans]|uniref:hypothetical protein n=1 Tax=Pseudarthrobacter phenanthrenivorans TaxID=361575 RepID=UPI001128A03F|nr:hypothetical protein [Pseudarthrobacter phenanthrenivorans]TPV51491.1 hypothetical protein FJ661_08315 [Pseudarthrobacter phenanthrenivorans]